MPDLNVPPIIEIRKDENGVFWMEIDDKKVSDHEVIGILHMMIIRMELTIRKQEIEKSKG